MAPLPLADWRAEQLRLSAFPVLGAGTHSTAWWEMAAGFPPEEITSNTKKGSSVVTGSFGPSSTLVLKMEPDRIDWVLLPQDIDPESVAEPDFPNIGPAIEALTTFAAVAEAWMRLDDVPELTRLAFGAVLRHSEPDRRAGYLRLPDYVPIRVNPDSSDFLYQINLPAASQRIEGLVINRLSKWSIAAFKLIALRMTVGAEAPRSIPTPEIAFALRLELDINTAPTFDRPLPRAQLVDVYRELAGFGQQIVVEGISGNDR